MDSEQKAKLIERFTGARRQALLPVDTVLDGIGFPRNGRVADIGCGIGYFTLPLAQRLVGTIVALDVSDDMLALLRERAEEAGLRNIEIARSEPYGFPLRTEEMDGALICNVLHEVREPERLLREAARVLKRGALLAVVEWRKVEQSMGPPIDERLSVEELSRLLAETGFADLRSFSVSEASVALVGTRA